MLRIFLKVKFGVLLFKFVLTFFVRVRFCKNLKEVDFLVIYYLFWIWEDGIYDV